MASLAEKLERRAKQLERGSGLKYGSYEQPAFDDRELFEQAARRIRELEIQTNLGAEFKQ